MTAMVRSNAIQQEPKASPAPGTWPHWYQNDPRWNLAERVVAGSHFSRAALLSKFLLYVIAKTLEGREREITEHQIGVRVFDRRPGYSTVEDNIVRNYARQLRKRLADHFAGEGSAEPLRIDIPLGGYVPVFASAADMGCATKAHRLFAPVSIEIKAAHDRAESPGAAVAGGPNWKRWLLGACLLAVYSVALVCATRYAGTRGRTSARSPDPVHSLWAALFQGSANTYIVPADAGFNLLEDLSHRPLALADYIQSGYLELPLSGVDAHSAGDLRSQQFTSFVDLQTVAALARLPEYEPQRVLLRFPRDLRIDDLKNANAVLIGSVGSNPWAALAENSGNFRIVYDQGMESATILNAHPQSGEDSSYVSHWNAPAHDTYALIAFLPNLGGGGHLLLLQGLDVAGTQAAAETLLHPAAIEPILRHATRSDGSLRFFEILLRSSSIESNSAGTQVIASRIYCERPRNAPVGGGRFVMDSVYERRVWSGGWSSWPSGDRAAGKFVSDECLYRTSGMG
jgi:hypothetical protein